MSRLVVPVMLLVLVSQHAAAGGSRLHQLQPADASTTAADFSLVDHNGVQHRLSDYRGRVVVINFWSTWCIPCRKEMPALENAQLRLKPSGAVVLSVAMQDQPEAIDRFLEKVPVSFPILMDHDGSTAAQWGVIGIPTTFILDTSGRTVYKATGIREWDDDPIINAILALTKTAPPADQK